MPLNKKKVRNSVRSALRKVTPWLVVFSKILALGYSRRSFLRESGYIKSTALKRPCKRDGSPIPWMNYAVVAFLEERLSKGMSMLEYGSGNSTLFYAQRVREVTSIENDKKWYDFFVKQLPENASLVLCDPYTAEAYVNPAAIQGERFDVIVVDGAGRNDCLYKVQNYLTEHGVVVLDDTHGDVTKPGIEFLLNAGFKRIEFTGIKPGGIRSYNTSILYRSDNCFNI